MDQKVKGIKVEKRKSEKQGFLVTMQKIGKSLVFPIAVLPAAALFLRIGDAVMATGKSGPDITNAWTYWIGWVLVQMGSAVFNNLAIIFAIGVGFGFSKDSRGEAALVAAVGYFAFSLLTQSPRSLSFLYYSSLDDGTQNSFMPWLLFTPAYFNVTLNQWINGTWVINLGVFAGIFAGLFSAMMYNRYSNVRLHPALGFFSGRRFVPMVVLIFSAVIAFPVAAIWPWLQIGLVRMSEGLASAPEAAAGVYAFANRLLIPFGLHQVLNSYFWFQNPTVTTESIQVGTELIASGATVYYLNSDTQIVPLLGDITAFLNAKGTIFLQGSTGMIELSSSQAQEALKSAHVGIYQTGFFPIMMFGLPALGFALAKNADKENKRAVWLFVGSAALVSFLTGITEPLEFTFMFISPVLYFSYALLSGGVAAATVATGASMGFGFSAGAVDFGLSYINSMFLSQGISSYASGAMGGVWILIMGIASMPIYYFMADIIIRKQNLATIGRNGNMTGLTHSSEANEMNSSINVDRNIKQDPRADRLMMMAVQTIKLVHPENITEVDNCITRVRLTLRDNTHITREKATKIGYTGYVSIGNKAAQFIIGPDSEVIANNIRDLLRDKNLYDSLAKTHTSHSHADKPRHTSHHHGPHHYGHNKPHHPHKVHPHLKHHGPHNHK